MIFLDHFYAAENEHQDNQRDEVARDAGGPEWTDRLDPKPDGARHVRRLGNYFVGDIVVVVARHNNTPSFVRTTCSWKASTGLQ